MTAKPPAVSNCLLLGALTSATVTNNGPEPIVVLPSGIRIAPGETRSLAS